MGARQDLPSGSPCTDREHVGVERGVARAGSPGGIRAQVPSAQAHGLGLFTLLLPAPLPSLSSQAPGQARVNCSVDDGSRKGLPTTPLPCGASESWNWQHQVDQSQSAGPRNVRSTAATWGNEARREARSTWSPHLPGSHQTSPPLLPVAWPRAPTPLSTRPGPTQSPHTSSPLPGTRGMVWCPLCQEALALPPHHVQSGAGQTFFPSSGSNVVVA